MVKTSTVIIRPRTFQTSPLASAQVAPPVKRRMISVMFLIKTEGVMLPTEYRAIKTIASRNSHL